MLVCQTELKWLNLFPRVADFQRKSGHPQRQQTKEQVKQMKRLNYLTTFVAGAALLSAVADHARADTIIAPAWNLPGSYELEYTVQDGTYGLNLDVTSEDFATGAFTATSTSDVSVSDGDLQGSAISFDISSGPCNSVGFSGTVAPDGTFSGSVVANNCHGPFYGGFSTVSGHCCPN
jgi:hypothetical protein